MIEQVYDHQGNIGNGTVPLLVLDMWEHAYYLQYENAKGEWVKAFWKVATGRTFASGCRRFAPSTWDYRQGGACADCGQPAVGPRLQQHFNQTEDRGSERPGLGVAWLDCRANGHKLIVGTKLTQQEKQDLVAFLRTL